MFESNEQYEEMSGINNMATRINYLGGKLADDRLNKGKLKSMLSAQGNSYQAEWITLDGSEEKWRCLINPDKLKEDYDQKEISIEFEAGLKEGDTFYWDRTNTHWITYLQEYSEEAYFRANIRRCNYSIEVNGHKYWVYLRGPVETSIIWRQKHQIEFNDLNYSLIMYVTKTEETQEFFTRFRTMKFGGHNWRVAATDRYSQRGIIEVNLEEHYDNPEEDEMIIPEIEIFGEDEPHIEGPQFVKIFSENVSYSIKNASHGSFVVSSNKVKIVSADENTLLLNIVSGKQGSFKIIYREEGKDDIELEVTIESF